MNVRAEFLQKLVAVPVDERKTISYDSKRPKQMAFQLKYEYQRDQRCQQSSTFMPLSERLVQKLLDPVYAINTTKQNQVCVHFINGNCRLGDKCPYLHEKQ